jgi:glycine/D-amino acid oxidase-like deaminating enzyme
LRRYSWPPGRAIKGETPEGWRPAIEGADSRVCEQTPMIGTYTPVSTRMFVAAGFSKWGLTDGTTAATQLVERLGGRREAGTFSPRRVSPRGLPRLARL